MLHAKDLYLLGMGILPLDALDAIDASALRLGFPDLFPAAGVAQRKVDEALQRAFIVRITAYEHETVVRVLAADDEYMRRRGIID